MHPGEEQLAAEAVVVPDPGAGDGEAEDAVEDHGVLDQLGVPAGLRVSVLVLLDLHRFAEGGEVAAQLLQRVEEERHALLDHERVEGQVPAHVGAVVDQVPHDKGFLRQLLVLQQPGGVLGQLQGGDLGGGAQDAAEAGGLAVGEDRAPRERRGLADGDGLGEEDCGVGVVARGEVEEADRDEELVGVFARFQAADELGPDDLDQHGLDEAAAAAVLGVHREHDQVLESVDPVLLRLEGLQGVQEVRDAKAAIGPAVKVGDQQFKVVRASCGKDGARAATAAVMVATWPAAASWASASGTDPSWTWRARRAVAAALSRSHSWLPAVIGAGAVRAVVVIVDGRLSGCCGACRWI